ncbi:hypothetical protein [Subtercola vilae]|nr:hypothetical protein [Subtercola vilae]
MSPNLPPARDFSRPRRAPRQKLPLWRWDPFLVAAVLGFSIVAALFQRLDIAVVSPIALTLLLSAAVLAALLEVLPFFVPRLRRDGEGSLALRQETELLPPGHPVAAAGSAPRDSTAHDSTAHDSTLPVVDAQRHQGSIEAALARGGPEFVAVLVPRATAWMGRDYRVAVDLLVGERLYRAGFLPRESDQAIAAQLVPFADRKQYRTVPVGIRTTTKGRVITVDVGPLLAP